jgi:hypothetical protein
MSTDGNRNPDSPPPAAPPPVGSRRDGSEPYEGIQNEQLWTASELDSRGIIDGSRKPGLYRLTLIGRNVECSIRYGTNATLLLTGVRTPVVMTIPGQVGVSAKPLGGGGAEVSATLVRVTASSEQHCRRKRSDPGAFEPAVVSFYTLEACSITIDGTNYAAVPAFTRVPLIQPSSLVSGSGFEEFDP